MSLRPLCSSFSIQHPQWSPRKRTTLCHPTPTPGSEPSSASYHCGEKVQIAAQKTWFALGPELLSLPRSSYTGLPASPGLCRHTPTSGSLHVPFLPPEIQPPPSGLCFTCPAKPVLEKYTRPLPMLPAPFPSCSEHSTIEHRVLLTCSFLFPP